MAILSVKNLTKRFGDFVAVDSVSFSLAEGEILGLLGPNGAGKTTTIQMLLGVLTPTAGQTEYFDLPFSSHREAILERVSFSSTYTNLPWDLTVGECLSFLSYFYNIKNRPGRIAQVIRDFRLDQLLHERISELSAGQLTRLNLAKAFLNEPAVLLLDEPTASLDPDVASYIRDFLLEHRATHRTSMIFTSHNMAEVEEVCDRVIFINHGKIIADDTPQALARTMQFAHVELYAPRQDSQLADFCRQRGLDCSRRGRYTAITLPEADIPQFLRDLDRAGIRFEEISIDKPSLEDYFLQQARQKP